MLRTRIVDNRLALDGIYVDADNIEFFQAESVHHDAAYAHALVQAMDEADPNSDYQLGTELDRIKRRAAEIMRGFGYETDT